MKIAVITPYDSSNYGAYLQAYCLKYQLEKMGHEVIHVPTRNEDYVRNLYYRDKPISKKDKYMPWAFKRKVEFGKHKEELFLIDQKEFKTEALENVRADLYILGSDEIWNISQPVFRKLIFWGVGLSPVISYAASIGSADVDVFSKYPEQINAIRQLSSILVRDMRTKEFVKKYTNIDANVVCDPTMLVSVDKYGKTYEDDYIKNHDCLLIYAYRLNRKIQKSIRAYAKKNNLKIVSCCFQHDWCDYQCDCTPLQFSSLIQQCKRVITTTFHGSIFSILNHARFVTIPTSPKSNQLLEQLQLNECLLPEKDVTPNNIDNILNKIKIDYFEVDKCIQILQEKSLKYLENAIKLAETQNKSYDYQICPANQCTGCFACMNKCPKQAIECITDIQGRTLPKIDTGKCIKCGLCKNVCPQLNPVELSEPQICYAAQRSDKKLQLKSASGGIAAVFTEQILSGGGCAFGAAYTKENIVAHQKAENEDEAIRFRGSKYVQSYIGNTYRDVLSELKTGRDVLFTGTPCQIAGLKKYLGKDYDNLYCIDIICHGIPPMEYLKQYLHLRIKGEIDNITFRLGTDDFRLMISQKNHILYNKGKFEDVYYHSFLKGLIYRENCYHCSYAQKNRCSDITIGDFWGLKRNTLKTNLTDNISVVLINTVKGRALFSSIERNLKYEEREIDEAVIGNAQLRQPSVIHPKREYFINQYIRTQNFEQSVLSCNVKREMLILRIKRTKIWRALAWIKHVFN